MKTATLRLRLRRAYVTRQNDFALINGSQLKAKPESNLIDERERDKERDATSSLTLSLRYV